MLILSRRRGQALIIGEAEVVILDVDPRGRVTVGVKAPPDTLVLRRELADRTLPLRGERRSRGHLGAEAAPPQEQAELVGAKGSIARERR